MKKLGEILDNDQAELARHVERAKASGRLKPEFVDKVVAAAESPRDAIDDLKGLMREPLKGHPSPLPPEVHERTLDPHEEALHEDMLSGRLKHFENGEQV